MHAARPVRRKNEPSGAHPARSSPKPGSGPRSSLGKSAAAGHTVPYSIRSVSAQAGRCRGEAATPSAQLDVPVAGGPRRLRLRRPQRTWCNKLATSRRRPRSRGRGGNRRSPSTAARVAGKVEGEAHRLRRGLRSWPARVWPVALDVRRARRDTPGVSWVAHLNNAGAALPPWQVTEAVIAHLRREAETGG
jgi:hypothetical protein